MKNDFCMICEKHEKQVAPIFQDDLLYVSHRTPKFGEDEVYLGYYFIEPKRHFRGMYDATDEEMAALGIMMRRLSRAMLSIPNMEHVYSFMIGEGLDHFHIHIVGRYKDTPREYYGPQVDEWKEAYGNIAAVDQINQLIRQQLEK